MKHRKYTVVRGETDADLDDALDEALRLIGDEGCLAGKGSTDAGAYYFDSTEHFPEGERCA